MLLRLFFGFAALLVLQSCTTMTGIVLGVDSMAYCMQNYDFITDKEERRKACEENQQFYADARGRARQQEAAESAAYAQSDTKKTLDAVQAGIIAAGNTYQQIQTGTGASGVVVAAQFETGRFPDDIEYVNGPGLEVDRYYQPLGCVDWTPREMPNRYDFLNNCRYTVDVYFHSGPYEADYVYGDLPRAGLRPGKTASQAYASDELGTPIACVEVDSLLLISRKGDLEGVPDYQGHICRRRQPSDGGRTGTAQ